MVPMFGPSRLASLSASEWHALAQHVVRPRRGILGVVDRLRSTGDYFRLMRGGTVPSIERAYAMWWLKTIIDSTEARPSLGAYVVAQNGLIAVLFRSASSDEFFQRAYAGVSAVIPIETILT